MGLREQWIRPLDALPQDYQHVIAITSSGQEEEMYLVDDKWHIVDGVRIPIEFVVFWHEKREQPTVEMAEDCVKREDAIRRESVIEWLKDKDILKTKNQEENARRELDELPSVTPQPKRGKWIGEESLDGSIRYMCDNCKEFEYVDYYDFCPNCGAKMEVEDANNS